MSELNDNKFDLEIRSLFDDAREDVPGHIWESIQDRLDIMDSAKRRKLVLLWLSSAVIATAAAAAVILTLFLPGTFTQDNIIDPYSDNAIALSEKHIEKPDLLQGSDIGLTASNAENVIIAKETEAAKEPASIIVQHVDDAVEEMPTEETAIPETGDAEEKTIVETSAEIAGKYVAESVTPREKSVEQQYEDLFRFEDEEENAGSGISTSIALFGNALSNNGSKNGARTTGRPIMMSQKKEQTSPLNETGKSTYGVPVSFGIGTKVKFTPHWAIGAGINYTLLTRTFSGTYTQMDGNNRPDIKQYSKIRNSQSYIGIPVNVYFSFIQNDIVDFYAYAGGAAEKCVDNRFFLEPHKDYTEKVKGFQFSANAGIGVEFIAADILGIYIDPSIRYYFKDENQPKSIRTRNPLSFGFEIGFRVRL